jgi:acetolactate synthase small subunit
VGDLGAVIRALQTARSLEVRFAPGRLWPGHLNRVIATCNSRHCEVLALSYCADSHRQAGTARLTLLVDDARLSLVVHRLTALVTVAAVEVLPEANWTTAEAGSAHAATQGKALQ